MRIRDLTDLQRKAIKKLYHGVVQVYTIHPLTARALVRRRIAVLEGTALTLTPEAREAAETLMEHSDA